MASRASVSCMRLRACVCMCSRVRVCACVCARARVRLYGCELLLWSLPTQIESSRRGGRMEKEKDQPREDSSCLLLRCKLRARGP